MIREKKIIVKNKRKVLKEFESYCIGALGKNENTLRNYKCDVNGFLDYLNHYEIKPEDIDPIHYRNYLLNNKKLSNNSINRKFCSIKVFYSCLKYEGYVFIENPFDNKDIKSLKRPKKSVKILNEEEVHGIKEYFFNRFSNNEELKDRYIMLIEVLQFTGMRFQEVLDAKVKDIDLRKRVLFIPKAKGNKERNVPLNDKLGTKLNNYIKKYKHMKGDYLLFREGSRKREKLNRGFLSREMRKAFDYIGREDVSRTAHIFRSTFITNLVRAGVNPAIIADIVGHDNLNTTYGYISFCLEENKKAVDLL